jgi:hypothetical protein
MVSLEQMWRKAASGFWEMEVRGGREVYLPSLPDQAREAAENLLASLKALSLQEPETRKSAGV